MLDLDAVVLDVGEPARLGDGSGLGAADTELEPERTAADGDRGAGDLRRELRAAEHVHDVDRLRHLVEELPNLGLCHWSLLDGPTALPGHGATAPHQTGARPSPLRRRPTS